MDLTVELPACGYYKSQNRSEESYCFYCNYYETSTIWALTENGFTEAQKEAVTVFIKDKTADVSGSSGRTAIMISKSPCRNRSI